MLRAIHFVGGLGRHEGRDLQPNELLAVRLAKLELADRQQPRKLQDAI